LIGPNRRLRTVLPVSGPYVIEMKMKSLLK
jgi:hypothetical protein